MPIVPEEPMSIGELGRMIKSLDRKVEDGFAVVNRRLDSRVPREVYNSERQAMLDRISAVESTMEADEAKVTATRRWIAGLLVAVVIALLPYAGVPTGVETGS